MLMGIECDDQSGFHLPDGHLYVEIVDPETNELLDPGQQGEIVITTLLREGMPLLRYRTGDLGFIEESGCTCGINLPKLHLRGRTGDQIVLQSGSFSPFYLEDIIMQVEGVGNWYRFLVKDKSLTVEVEPFNDEVDKEYLAQQIEEKIEFYTNSPCTAEVVEKVQRNDGKIKRVWYID
jgi:phenylacetate-CoA ligase